MSASGLCGNETMKEILQYLKKHGERLDTDIAEATGISLATVRLQLAELVAKCEVVACHSIRFVTVQSYACLTNGYRRYFVLCMNFLTS